MLAGTRTPARGAEGAPPGPSVRLGWLRPDFLPRCPLSAEGPGFAEGGDLAACISGFGEHGVGVLAEARGERPGRGGRVRESERRVERPERAGRVADFGEGLAMSELGVGHRLLDGAVARGGHAEPLERRLALVRAELS